MGTLSIIICRNFALSWTLNNSVLCLSITRNHYDAKFKLLDIDTHFWIYYGCENLWKKNEPIIQENWLRRVERNNKGQGVSRLRDEHEKLREKSGQRERDRERDRICEHGISFAIVNQTLVLARSYRHSTNPVRMVQILELPSGSLAYPKVYLLPVKTEISPSQVCTFWSTQFSVYFTYDHLIFSELQLKEEKSTLTICQNESWQNNE